MGPYSDRNSEEPSVPPTAFVNAALIFPDRVEACGTLVVRDGRIAPHGPVPPDATVIDLTDKYLSPGFVDLHVHGGDGADFMDLTPEAFRTVCRCHARHGTTSFTPTSTVSTVADSLRFLDFCGEFRDADTGGARILGGHLYGPYFAKPAKGCHPSLDFLTPAPANWQPYLKYAGQGLTTLTLAPELPDVIPLIQACVSAGVRVNIGHSHATFEQTEAAVAAGARHVDHLFCAMSDRARLRQAQAFPMRAGVMEATLTFDDLTTEVIADGWHLADSLLRVAYKVKGPDRLALVSDAMRAVDCPDGEYRFGSAATGELIRRKGDVGVTLDGTGLASGVMGQDHCLRVMKRATGAPLHELVRTATLTPARILGVDSEIGSLAAGKRADLVVLTKDLTVGQVFVGGRQVS
jgi:N-acetylglucosamine-6-phosphate deacetylase